MTYEGGEDVYPTLEEKAANLLYFVTKNHSSLHEAVREKKMDVALDLMQRGIDVDIQNVNGYRQRS